MVPPMIVSLLPAPLVYTPPPLAAVLPMRVMSLSVRLPALPMPPPEVAEPPVIVRPSRVAEPPVTWMIWKPPSPLMVTIPLFGSRISTPTGVSGRVSVLDRVIVCGVRNVPELSKTTVLGAGWAMFSGLSLELPPAHSTPERSVPARIDESALEVTR